MLRVLAMIHVPSVRLGQLSWITRLLDCESPGPIATLQILESVDGNSGCASCELQQPRLLLSIPSADNLHFVSDKILDKIAFHWVGSNTYIPEVNNDIIILSVTPVIGVLLPVIDIDISNTTDQQLKLPLVKDVDKLSRDELVEASDKGIELLLDTFLNTPLGDQPTSVSC